jgi:hypothetical protein
MKLQAADGLRAEVEASVVAAVTSSGTDGVWKNTLIKRFLGRGASKATLYRWVTATIATGKPGQAAVSAIKQAAAARAARTPDPVAEMVTEAGKHLPSVVRLEDVLGIPVIEVIERLNQVVANLDLLIDHAKTDDGKVRNAQFLLNATDRLRACLETTLKIHKAMRDLDRVDSLHNAILEEITKEAPEAAERILRRIGTIAGQWGG